MDKLSQAIVDAFTAALRPVVAAINDLQPHDVTTAGTRAFSVEAAPKIAVGVNRKRRSIMFINAGSATLELGYERGLTYGSGIPVPAGQSFSDNVNPHTGAWYAICATGTVDCRVAEVSYAERED